MRAMRVGQLSALDMEPAAPNRKALGDTRNPFRGDAGLPTCCRKNAN